MAANRRLVVSIARKYVFVSQREDDWETRLVAQPTDGDQLATLIPKGEEGLRTAVDRFDESKGFSFPAYATWWIRQAITEGRQGGNPGGVREPRSPAPATPSTAAHAGPPDN